VLGRSPAVSYAVAVGQLAQAISEAADRVGADAIVLPSQRDRPLRRLFSSSVAEDLRRLGGWEVLTAPPADRRRHSEASVTQPTATHGTAGES
jgi:nucleotide-binding universal stress UspA family protein